MPYYTHSTHISQTAQSAYMHVVAFRWIFIRSKSMKKNTQLFNESYGISVRCRTRFFPFNKFITYYLFGCCYTRCVHCIRGFVSDALLQTWRKRHNAIERNCNHTVCLLSLSASLEILCIRNWTTPTYLCFLFLCLLTCVLLLSFLFIKLFDIWKASRTTE